MFTAFLAALAILPPTTMPIQGLHIFAPAPNEVPSFTEFVRDDLPKEGVNTLVVEFDYNYKFKSHPEVAETDSLSEPDVKEIVRACHDAHIRLIPQINLLGHQSWAQTTNGLLRSHPEFDETRGKYPNNKGIMDSGMPGMRFYCRSYCPLAPGLHKVVFDLIDELAAACETDAFHCGMDEVMILADKDCPRCHRKSTADLFAGEVNALHDHLKSKGLQMWMWGDRFIDGKTTGIGDWEASGNNTQSALAKVPKDIVICDWHYDRPVPTPAYFAMAGMPVLTCPWRNIGVANMQLQQVKYLRSDTTNQIGNRVQGVLETTWVPFGEFLKAYNGDTSVSRDARESAACFKAVFKEIRGE